MEDPKGRIHGFKRGTDGLIKRDKSLNTPEFNKKAKRRREKAKHDAKQRQRNRRK